MLRDVITDDLAAYVARRLLEDDPGTLSEGMRAALDNVLDVKDKK